MTHLRFVVAIFAIVVMLGTAALAKDEWKTVTLGGDPDFTISIPTAVTDYGGGKDADDLMFFSVVAAGQGAMMCMAHRTGYAKDSTQATFAAAIATERRERFCGQDGASVSGLNISGSTSYIHNGLQAAVCTASYTDSAQKLPGRVTSQLVVAAPGKATFVTCTIEDEDQDTAEYAWSALWGEKVRHIQDSFHLPK